MLVLGLERGPDHARRGVVDEDVERAERRDLLRDRRRRDVAADEHGLGAERAQLLGGLLGRGVGAEVADRDARRAVAREAQRDRPADPARAARDEDGARRALTPPRGSGCDAGADDGIVSQPIRLARLAARSPRPSTRRSPSRSSSSIFSSP